MPAFGAADAALTENLRETASAHGWPAGVSTLLSATVSEGGVVEVHYPPAIQEQVFDLEYGTTNIPPAPAIRRFLQRVELGDEFFLELFTSHGVI